MYRYILPDPRLPKKLSIRAANYKELTARLLGVHRRHGVGGVLYVRMYVDACPLAPSCGEGASDFPKGPRESKALWKEPPRDGEAPGSGCRWEGEPNGLFLPLPLLETGSGTPAPALSMPTQLGVWGEGKGKGVPPTRLGIWDRRWAGNVPAYGTGDGQELLYLKFSVDTQLFNIVVMLLVFGVVWFVSVLFIYPSTVFLYPTVSWPSYSFCIHSWHLQVIVDRNHFHGILVFVWYADYVSECFILRVHDIVAKFD